MSWSLIAFLALNFAAALSGGLFTPGEWHRNLNKPWFHPPNWAFPVVWSILYILNAIAGWLVWTEVGLVGIGFYAFAVYVISLVLNAGWSAIFFGMKNMQLALLEAILLWFSIALQIVLFWQVNPVAGLISFPYLIWVSVAVLLNRSMLKLNPQA